MPGFPPLQTPDKEQLEKIHDASMCNFGATGVGVLTQQNAEALLGISLLQLTNPGTLVVYGGFTSNVNVRSGTSVSGAPKNYLANMVGG